MWLRIVHAAGGESDLRAGNAALLTFRVTLHVDIFFIVCVVVWGVHCVFFSFHEGARVGGAVHAR